VYWSASCCSGTLHDTSRLGRGLRDAGPGLRVSCALLDAKSGIHVERRPRATQRNQYPTGAQWRYALRMVRSVGWETPLERICHQCDRILDNRHYRTAGSRGMFVHDSVPSDAPCLPQNTEDISALALHAPSPTRGSKKANVFPIFRWVAAPAAATDARTTTPPTRGSPHHDERSTVLRPDIHAGVSWCATTRTPLAHEDPGHGQKNHRSQHCPLLASLCSPPGSPRRSERHDRGAPVE